MEDFGSNRLHDRMSQMERALLKLEMRVEGHEAMYAERIRTLIKKVESLEDATADRFDELRTDIKAISKNVVGWTIWVIGALTTALVGLSTVILTHLLK